jgi:hypothetical protein
LRIPGRERHPVGDLTVQTDLEGILSRTGEGNIEDQHGTSLHVYHPGGWLTELHGAFATEELAPTLVHETNADGVDSDLRTPAPHSQDQMSSGIHGWEIREPDMLEHPQHAELALLIDQGIIGDDGEIEVQGSGDSD